MGHNLVGLIMSRTKQQQKRSKATTAVEPSAWEAKRPESPVIGENMVI